MNDLRELIGKEVTVYIEDKKEDVFLGIRSIVTDVTINTHRFEEKSEPIYIEVQADPLTDLPKGVDYQDFDFIPLENITK